MAGEETALVDEFGQLRALSVAELRVRYLEVFGEKTTNRNKDYLLKRIAYRMQEQRFGGLTLRARARAELLAEDVPIRWRLLTSAEAPEVTRPTTRRDPRLPPAGTELRRTCRGVEHVVTVLEGGFRFRGNLYRSLSVIAYEITGTRWNGYSYFGLRKGPAERPSDSLQEAASGEARRYSGDSKERR